MFDPAAPIKWKLVQDCRRLFPPVTELTSLLYVGGDGQEALPNSKLLEPLQVRVANGQFPVKGAKVRFQVVSGGGSVSGQNGITATVDPDGIAECEWTLGPEESQQVEARMLDAAEGDVPGQVVVFDATTERDRLLYVSGDGQEALPNDSLLADLQVRVLNKHVPVIGAHVQFNVASGGGALNGQNTNPVVVATVGPDGFASCKWTLGPDDSQSVEARLRDGNNPVPGQVVIFHANTSTAKKVAYNPGNCPDLKGATTVQQAIDILCQERDKEPGIGIKELFLFTPRTRLLNDSEVTDQHFASGILVECSERIDPFTIERKPTFVVTLDLPYPLNQADLNLWDLHADSVLGFQPLILNGQVKVGENNILWVPTERTSSWLKPNLMNRIFKLTGLTRLLVRLRLVGNFIVAQDAPGHWLDGDTFGGPNSKIVQIGDGRRGGDFEMWFWLVSGAPAPPPLGGIRGTVTDNTGAVIAGATVTLINLTTGTTVTSQTDAQGAYVFPTVAPGKYQVDVAAQGFQKIQRSLDVQAGQPAGVDVALARV